MDTGTLLNEVLDKTRRGLKIESSNLDLKKVWWDSPSEFIKDICAFGNTHASTSYIVLGVNEKGEVTNVPLPKDEATIQSQLKEKIIPKLEIAFYEREIEGKKVTIVKIPHSRNRPHLIRNVEGKWWVPIRIGSSTDSVTRSDLDQMYQERIPLNSPDVEIELVENEGVRWDCYSLLHRTAWCFSLVLKLDNYQGTRPDYLKNVVLSEQSGDKWRSKHFYFERQSRLDGPLEIQAEEAERIVRVYLLDEEPSGLNIRRERPDIDVDNMLLTIETRSGKPLSIPIKAVLMKT